MSIFSVFKREKPFQPTLRTIVDDGHLLKIQSEKGEALGFVLQFNPEAVTNSQSVNMRATRYQEIIASAPDKAQIQMFMCFPEAAEDELNAWEIKRQNLIENCATAHAVISTRTQYLIEQSKAQQQDFIDGIAPRALHAYLSVTVPVTQNSISAVKAALNDLIGRHVSLLGGANGAVALNAEAAARISAWTAGRGGKKDEATHVGRDYSLRPFATVWLADDMYHTQEWLPGTTQFTSQLGAPFHSFIRWKKNGDALFTTAGVVVHTDASNIDDAYLAHAGLCGEQGISLEQCNSPVVVSASILVHETISPSKSADERFVHKGARDSLALTPMADVPQLDSIRHGGVLLASRNGVLTAFDLHAQQPNANVLLVGNGYGVNLFITEILLSHLSERDQVVVIDSHRSFGRLGQICGFEKQGVDGDQYESINPFGLATLEGPLISTRGLVSLVLGMACADVPRDWDELAYPREGEHIGLELAESLRFKVRAAITEAIAQHGTETGLAQIYEELLNQEQSTALSLLIRALRPFAIGRFSYLFNGRRQSVLGSPGHPTVVDISGVSRFGLRDVVRATIALNVLHEKAAYPDTQLTIVMPDIDASPSESIVAALDDIQRKVKKCNGSLLLGVPTYTVIKGTPAAALRANAGTLLQARMSDEEVEGYASRFARKDAKMLSLMKTPTNRPGAIYEFVLAQESAVKGPYRLVLDPVSLCLFSLDNRFAGAIDRGRAMGQTYIDAATAISKLNIAHN